jgi:hypothetical protein
MVMVFNASITVSDLLDLQPKLFSASRKGPVANVSLFVN